MSDLTPAFVTPAFDIGEGMTEEAVSECQT
jgi:hypothetical protein